MGDITLHRKKTGKVDIMDKRLIEQAYGSDYPNKIMVNPFEFNAYVDSTIFSKTMVPSVDLEEGLSILKEEDLSE